MIVSIIVPIYHGKKYIPDLICQAERNAEHSSCELELLLVNDDSKIFLNEKWNSSSIQIHVINTDRNRGIHGTRVRGLTYAVGEFVLFLDQDDWIAPDYIKKQLERIGKADAVVCSALENQEKYYHKGRVLQECIQRDYMTQKGNFIISPGQVLLRKVSIPDFWKENILIHNGADDWFLWICMLCAGKSLVCNQEILFEHTVHTENTSANGFSMLNSMKEVYEKLLKNRDCTKKELRNISQIIKEHENNYVKERDKLLEFYFLLDDWMTLRERQVSIADYIRRRGYKAVSIYGKGRIGLRLARELKRVGIEVDCFIDRNAEVLSGDIKTISIEEIKDTREPIIITLSKADAKEVGHRLKERGAEQVIFLSDIIRCLINMDDNCRN